MEFTNKDIEEAFRNGDEKVFEQLFRYFYKSLCQYANSILKDTDEAEEIVQQMFTTIWEKRLTLEFNVSIKSYLFRAVHNNCLSYLEKTKVRNLYATQKLKEIEPTSEHAASLYQSSELQKKIAFAIQKLPDQCRNVFTLSRHEEMKYAEIASHLGISIKTVENHMGKALRIMREELKEFLPIITIIVSIIHCLIN